MKKVTYHAVAVAVGALFAGSAFAGSISAPATPTKFAVEALAPLPATPTAVTTPTITYTMGVGRPVGNGFTIIVDTTGSSTFGATCVVPTYTATATGTVSVTLKRSSATECAYDVQVTAATAVGDTFTWTGQTFATHTLATVGSTIGITVNLKDPGETAQVDNQAPIAGTLAVSVQSVNIYAVAADTATTADVNAVGGPLTGFIAGGLPVADTVSQANARLLMDNNSVNAKIPSGAANFDFTATAGTASLVLTGNTSGAATNGYCYDLNNNGTCDVGERFVLTSNTATLASIPSTAFPAVGTTAFHTVLFNADGVTQLGTSRNFVVSGTITPVVGSPESLANTNSIATWWTWGANASQLVTAYFNTNPRFVTRFLLLNTGPAVSYSAKCYYENGTAAGTPGASASGKTLAANATTNIDATTLCTFDPVNPRGAVIFTINAPINNVKGVYNVIDRATGNANGFIELTRPYDATKPTE
jgi:hypothetical protein